jgi:DNA-binding MarR family transcriptional regulator
MTDINQRALYSPADAGSAAARIHNGSEPGSDTDPAMLDIAELLFFAYRDFICEPDTILCEFGFGRAHHRVLHFVNRHPGMRVADLLVILKITKQSLGRVLKQLVDEGFIAQKAGQSDRRERLLYPTQRGKELAERLARPQLERIAHSLAKGGPDAEKQVREFLYRMVSDSDRPTVAGLLDQVRRNGAESQETP